MKSQNVPMPALPILPVPNADGYYSTNQMTNYAHLAMVAQREAFLAAEQDMEGPIAEACTEPFQPFLE